MVATAVEDRLCTPLTEKLPLEAAANPRMAHVHIDIITGVSVVIVCAFAACPARRAGGIEQRSCV
jgi:hypothetical protein